MINATLPLNSPRTGLNYERFRRRDHRLGINLSTEILVDCLHVLSTVGPMNDKNLRGWPSWRCRIVARTRFIQVNQLYWLPGHPRAKENRVVRSNRVSSSPPLVPELNHRSTFHPFSSLWCTLLIARQTLYFFFIRMKDLHGHGQWISKSSTRYIIKISWFLDLRSD